MSASLLTLPAAWLLVKQWAADALLYVNLEIALSDLGNFDYSKWRKTFRKVELASDPSEDHSISAVEIVIEAARAHGITLSNNESDDTATAESSCPSGSQKGSQGSSCDLGRTHKRRKLSEHRFLDLDAAEGDDEEETDFELDDKIQHDLLRLRQIGRSELQAFSENLSGIASRYSDDTGRQSYSLPCRLDAPAGGDVTRCYYVNFYSRE